MGEALSEGAGSSITFLTEQKVLPKYKVDDAISAYFPRPGTFSDWSYGAGWDTTDDAAISSCDP